MVEQNRLFKILFFFFAGAGLIMFPAGLIFGIIEKEPFIFIFAGMGLIFAAVGIIPLAVSAKKKKAKIALRENGQRVEAVITQIELNTAISVNGVHPYNIICESRDQAGEVRVYTSENIYRKLDSSLVGKPITVIVSRDDPDKYLVDTFEYSGVA